ncbi:MAG: ATP-dependent RecD-like DNA helicase [Erysipelotrichia bacterium]|nr:ATP-dependent RecD-like DNA helicase [Erysipelotrichia bacterium]
MEIKGFFTKILFYKRENGYAVALFSCTQPEQEESVPVTGYFGEIKLGESYCLEGSYIDHPKYGIQFKTESFNIMTASDEQWLINYFSGPFFKGIGKKYAKIIVDALGLEAIKQIRVDNNILDKIPQMNTKRKKAILEGIGKENDDDIAFLLGHHFSMQDIIRLKNKYKSELMTVLYDNPYQIIAEINGLGFAKVDKFAMSIGIPEDNFFRICAYCETLLMELCMKSGDSYVEYEEYVKYIQKKTSAFSFSTDEVIQRLQIERRIVREDDRVYPISQYESEEFISHYLCDFPKQEVEPADTERLFREINKLQEELAITYQHKQLQAIMSFFENDLLIVTGGPGTGKTTIVAAMLDLAAKIYPHYSINLLAPTGRAAKRLSQLTGYDAKTIHSVLLWDKETGKFAKDEKDPLTTDILIVDEFSMVDQYLFYRLLKAATYCRKIIIIGDSDQLPSVAMGAVLRDLIDSQLFTTVKLDKIYRQKEGSDIIGLAYDIKNNCLKEVPVKNDIRFFECDPSSIKDILVQVVDKALKCYGTLEEGFMNVQVLAPKHSGLNGIDRLNKELQEEFNPPDMHKKQLKLGYRIYREKDKILQLKNQPDDDVYNGDIGIVKEIITAKEDYNSLDRIIVDFDGRIVEYTGDTFSNITHAYCMSVHKAQGSEYPIVILPISNEYNIMLQKRLIYTAVTRAYKSLIFIGQKQAFYRGINTVEHYSRKTTLKEKLLKVESYE